MRKSSILRNKPHFDVKGWTKEKSNQEKIWINGLLRDVELKDKRYQNKAYNNGHYYHANNRAGVCPF
jgi:hypothetical protein